MPVNYYRNAHQRSNIELVPFPAEHAVRRQVSWDKVSTNLGAIHGAVATVVEIAKAEALDDGEISRVLPLAFLAPDIVEAILDGTQPFNLTARNLKHLKPLPTSWTKQRQILGFPAKI